MTSCQGALYAILAADLVVVLIVAAVMFALGWFVGTVRLLQRSVIVPNTGRDHARPQRDDERRTQHPPKE